MIEGTHYTNHGAQRFLYCPKCWHKVMSRSEKNVQEPERKITVQRNI